MLVLAVVLRTVFEAVRGSPREPVWFLWAAVIVAFTLLWIAWMAQAKRWQDQGKSAQWRWLLNFVPGIGLIWIIVECGMMRGMVGPNRYGPDPLAPVPGSDVASRVTGESSSVVSDGEDKPTDFYCPGCGHPRKWLSAKCVLCGSDQPAVRTAPLSEIDEKYALLVKYSAKAREAEARLNQLPQELQNRFKLDAVASPSRVQEIADALLAKHEKRSSPFGDARLDALYQRLAPVGPHAQAEFQRVIAFLGNEADPDTVFQQLMDEHAEGLNATGQLSSAGPAVAPRQVGSPSSATPAERAGRIAAETKRLRDAMSKGAPEATRINRGT